MKFVIGDIHGEVTKLKTLVNSILDVDKNPELIFLGDYLDKGEDVLSTLKYLRWLSLEYKVIFLYGNHEYLWLNLHVDDIESISYLEKFGGMVTMNSFKAKSIIEAKSMLIDQFGNFFKELVPFWKDENFVVVHSGISPEDNHKNLIDIPLKNLLFNRYNFLKNDAYYLGRYKVIFGHTGFYFPFYNAFKIGVDTAACFIKEQPLTAFCIEGDFFINSDDLLLKTGDIRINYCPNIPRIKSW